MVMSKIKASDKLLNKIFDLTIFELNPEKILTVYRKGKAPASSESLSPVCMSTCLRKW